MASAITSLLGSSFADLATAVSVGMSNTLGSLASTALDQLLRARAERARAVLLDEIKEGLRPPKDPGEVDEFVAILYRYLRAAQEGTARLNLRLMARAIRSQIERDGLYASEFLRFAELISSLSREEVILLATRFRIRRDFNSRKQSPDWSDTKTVNALVDKALIPSVFATPVEMQATLTALQRTGLVWPSANETGGGPIWQDTPLLDRIATLAELEGALAAEDPLT